MQDPARFTSVGTIAPASISTSLADVYIVNGQASAVATYAAKVRGFVSAGGGLVIGAQAWYWSYSNPTLSHPSNKVLLPMGIVLSADYAESDYTFDSSKPPSQVGNLDVGLNCLEASLTGNTSSTCYTSDDGSITSIMEFLSGAAAYVPLDSSFWTRLEQVGQSAATRLVMWELGFTLCISVSPLQDCCPCPFQSREHYT